MFSKLIDFESSPLLANVNRGNQIDTFILIYDQTDLENGPLRFKQILATIREKIRSFPQFQYLYRPSLLSKNGESWKFDETFDAEFHVRHIALPKPGDWRQFCIQIARLHARPLDQTKPLWEINVIEGLDNITDNSKGHFALVCKVHHALMKNDFNMGMLWSLHDGFDAKEEESTIPDSSLTHILGDLMQYGGRKVVKPINKSLEMAINQGFKVSQSFAPIARFVTSNLFGQRKVPYTRFNTNISNFRVWETCIVDIKKLDKIKLAFPNAVYEDIVLSVLSRALKIHLSNLNELGSAQLRAFIIDSKKSDGTSTINVDVTSLLTEVEDFSESLDGFVNRNSEREKFKSLAIDTSELSPLQRLSFSNTLLHRIQSDLYRHPIANTALIFLPENKHQMSLLGAPLKYYSCVPEIVDGLGLVHTSTIIDGNLNLTFTSCREMMPDPELYRDALTKSFETLYQLAQQKIDK